MLERAHAVGTARHGPTGMGERGGSGGRGTLAGLCTPQQVVRLTMCVCACVCVNAVAMAHGLRISGQKSVVVHGNRRGPSRCHA